MTDWQPSASPGLLKRRAALLASIRGFFADRDVLEVETPLLCQRGVTDPAIENFSVPGNDGDRFLQSSPEYAMKRLLAANPIDIFQICKAFRVGEYGRRHNPEYTLLEWYRLGWDDARLIREVGELVCQILGRPGWQVWRYSTLFQTVLSVDPLTAKSADLLAVAQTHVGPVPAGLDRDGLLDLLFSHCIEPAIADWGVVLVRDYPASQAALARVAERHGAEVAARFECFVDGVELANGYWENPSAESLEAQFQRDQQARQGRDLPHRSIDERLMAATAAGFPDCAGVALGVDRLLALSAQCSDIRDTLSFDWARA